MAYLFVRHNVQDFVKWKQAYDVHQPVRKAAGLKDLYVWHNLDNANEISLLFEAADKLSKTEVGKTVLALALRNQADHKQHLAALSSVVKSLGWFAALLPGLPSR